MCTYIHVGSFKAYVFLKCKITIGSWSGDVTEMTQDPAWNVQMSPYLIYIYHG